MTQNFIQPKGSLNTQVDTSGLQQQLAQMFANQQLQGQAQAQAQAADPMRQTVNDLIKNKLLQEIEMPKYTTIQDVINAPKGQKLNTVFEMVDNNPDITRLLGSFLEGSYLDTKTGKFVHGGEAEAQRQEAKFEADRQKALAQMKEQNDLATAMNQAYTHMDIEDLRDKRARELAKDEFEWKKQENALDRALEREKMANALQRAYLIHGGNGSGGGGATGGAAGVEGTITGGAAGVNNTGINLNNLKMTAAERKALTENKTTLANIESGLDALEKNKDAYTLWKGLLGSDITNRIDPKGVSTRTQIDNITAVYRKWLTGAQMSDKERKAYERFLPAPTDNYNIVKAKLNGMKGAIERSNDAILSNYGVSASSKKDRLGLGL